LVAAGDVVAFPEPDGHRRTLRWPARSSRQPWPPLAAARRLDRPVEITTTAADRRRRISALQSLKSRQQMRLASV
jgi:hypothetical protein